MTTKNDHNDKKAGVFSLVLVFILCGLSLTFPGNSGVTLASYRNSIEPYEGIEWKSRTTAVISASFNATGYDEGVLLEWRTGFEANNLGFNIYREEGDRLIQVNPELIKGSALMTGAETRSAGFSYAWWDIKYLSERKDSPNN